MRRFFIDRELNIGDRAVLTGDEAKHIASVLRMQAGDRLILINGSGIELTAEIVSVQPGEVEVKIVDGMPCAAEPDCRVTLFQCLPKAGKMELIVQKCVELGVTDIRPVHSRRCVVKPERSENKLFRYNKVSQEASKQCGRGVAPAVLPVVEIKDIDLSAYDLVLIAYEDEDETSLKTALSEFKTGPSYTASSRIAVFIGPEGGFEPEEVEFILSRSKYARAVSLGKRILRTETAGMAMLAMLMYDLEG